MQRDGWNWKRRASGVLMGTLVVCLAFPGVTMADACDDLDTYGAYVVCSLRQGRKPLPASVWTKGRRIVPVIVEGDESPGNPLARRPYRLERLRHDRIRSRAETLSQHPRMRRYQAQAGEIRTDDDRRMSAFDVQSAPAGGSARALPGLKRHNDQLQKMVDKVQGVVDR